MSRWLLFPWLLLILLVPAFAADDHDHDHNETGPGKGKPAARPDAGPRRRAACGVRADTLSEFANGVAYDMPAMVNFLTAPECIANNRSLSATAIYSGVNFRSVAPFKLDNYAKLVNTSDLDSFKPVDIALSKSMPDWLRTQTLGNKELYPILGQTALLSPTAAKQVLVNLIERELYTADSVLSESRSTKQKTAVTAELARTLMSMGAGEPSVAAELAGNVEDLAVLAQADSLAKLFRSLGAATNGNPALGPTFNLSAAALNRGVQRGAEVYEPAAQDGLTKTVFEAVKAALAGTESLEEGTLDLNEALSNLIRGNSLDKTSLKAFWKEVLRVLAQTQSQVVLAEALASSLQVSVVYLSPGEMHILLLGAKNYPSVAYALQKNYLVSLTESWKSMKSGKLTVARFNQLKARFLEPLVNDILDLGIERLDHAWLREVHRKGFVRDEEIEKRFPRFVLALLEKREQGIRQAAKEGDFESSILSGAQDLYLVWSLAEVHVPALVQWVKKYDSASTGDAPESAE